MYKKMRIAAVAAVIAVGVAVGPALTASAVGGPVTGSRQCILPVPKVQIQSTAKGTINHGINGGATLDHWANGSSYITRFTPTAYSYLDWKVFLTGVGGDISYASAVCYS